MIVKPVIAAAANFLTAIPVTLDDPQLYMPQTSTTQEPTSTPAKLQHSTHDTITETPPGSTTTTPPLP